MNLLQLKQATAVVQPNHSILIYSPPKLGKTRLVGTAARIPEVKRIWWFDNENGHETLLHMGLTDEELSKIVLIRMVDTRETPVSSETILRAFTSKVPVSICELHGRVECAECAKEKLPSIMWHLRQCKHDELVVIDSGSQLGDSCMSAACMGKPVTNKPLLDDYGSAGKWLSDICSIIQQCQNTNFVVCTHEIGLEDDQGKEKIYPLMGTQNFSRKCSKYFGTVVYLLKKLGKHAAESSSTFRADVLTGSRLGIDLGKIAEPSMKDILIAGGILKRLTASSIPTEDKQPQTVEASVESTTKVEGSKPLTLAEKIALSKSKSVTRV